MKSEIKWYVILQVKARRKQLDMSQQYLADCLNVSQSFIRNIESRNTNHAYNIDHLNALAKLFKCSIRDFFPIDPV